MRRAAVTSLFLAIACAPKADTTVERSKISDPDPLRVLVTGFNDWKDLGDPPNVWRCRDNPSCRLLVGEPTLEAPREFGGPLVDALRQSERAIEWSFATLPVTWGVAAQRTPYAEYDVVVHIGLGVYDRDDEVFVEAGAYNRRGGTDAAGREVEGQILDGHPEVLAAPSGVAASVRAVDGHGFGAMRARVMPARVENTYLCNETHAAALAALSEARSIDGRPKAAYFVHIPQPKDGDWDALAQSVAGVVATLVSG